MNISTIHLFKKGILFLLVWLIPVIIASAQNKLSGTIVDYDNQALPGVNVLLLSPQDSSLIKGGVTDGQGKFSLAGMANGAYLINIRSIGIKSMLKEIHLIADTDMGAIKMESETTELNEVTVQATKPLFEQKLDRLVVNVQNSITAAGGSALDVLERSPGVMVNRGTNSLSLNGKDGIVVMINGKISRQSISSIMQLLSGLNANSIEKIELITNPPAKYEAAGNGGIINIQIAKRSDVGTNGSVSINGGYGQREKAGANIHFNHRENKGNLYGDFSYSRDHRYAIWSNNRTIIDDFQTITTQSVTDREPINTILNGRVGLDYQLTDKTLIGGFVTGFTNIWDMGAITRGSTVSSIDPASFVTVDLVERGRFKHLMGNFNVNQKLGKKTELNVDLDYLSYRDKNETTYDNVFTDEANTPAFDQLRKSNKRTPIHAWVANLGFTSSVSEKLQLEYGVKGISSRLTNDVMVRDLVEGKYVVDDAFSETSRLTENIGALYASTNYSMNDKTSIKLGLRYEYSNTDLDLEGKGKVVDLTINKLFPSIFLSRKIAKETSLQFSYGRRITRPSFGDLAPFFIFLDPTTFSYGNTSLKPAISDNIKVGFNYKQAILSIEHTYEDNAIEGFQPLVLEGTNQQMYTTLNLNYKNTTSLLVSVPVRFTSWWNMNISMLGVRSLVATPQNEKRDLHYYRINLTKNFLLSTDYSVEFSGFYQSASLQGISRMGGYQSVNLGVAKRFKNDSKLKFSLNNMFGFNFDFYTANGDKTYSNVATFRFERRIFNVSYSYNFGNEKLKTKRNRATGSDEIKNRVN